MNKINTMNKTNLIKNINLWGTELGFQEIGFSNIDLVNDLTTADWSNSSNIVERTINDSSKYKYYKITINECINNGVVPETTGIKFYYYEDIKYFDVTSDGIINTEKIRPKIKE